ncbi:hypothetical protein BU24DRAFT_444016 [Aaosphaeria arxii CBS 175.79]|uniref:Teneurin-like YD-shell domain-containing protein n=1 Tax=Aaosphaeria arxii CBS 175.79 TaxID=1450172 RepID=A0A6A5XC80_9PLEO|nr:uncharacterized protein BU24DRAFT_444016 [Aaosphaeria arxii CBS 175.79]KAF2010705.1 hypothetical protein BU24DRAFT_444016 [Aaosphaeria arxii CBS 175.79]
MSDVTYKAAIGRPHGKLDTDNNGLSRYMFHIDTPEGIKDGNAPDLSLQYSQGTPNGVLGLSWGLGGLSTIRRGAPKVVYDKLNPPPPGYDSTTPKLILDGTDLLNIEGDYLKPGTVYTTETNNTGLEIKSLGEGNGFLATDNTGRKTEYGTTIDSSVPITVDQSNTREWRVKRQTDCHGNTITYQYVASPVLRGDVKDANTSYLDTISYCSNSTAKVLATRIVKFNYEPRPDLVLQSVEGTLITWACRLSSISIGVIQNDKTIFSRTYSLGYNISPTTKDSFLEKVTESAGDGVSRVDLLPSLFTYTAGSEPGKIFSAQPSIRLSPEKNILTIIPMNMTGRSLTDLACMAWDEPKKTLTVKTYIANRDEKALISWTASEHNASLKLPKWDPKGGEAPYFLTPDLFGDGRSDLIIPYQNDQDKLQFFISQSNGLELTHGQTNTPTEYPWVPESRFMAMNMTGTGVIDVVQIFKNGENISFRNFSSIATKGDINLVKAPQTDTTYKFDNTIDWFLLKHSGSGAVSLVRIWKEFLSNDVNQYHIKTTSFRSSKVFDSSEGFDRTGKESVIGGPFQKEADDKPKWNVLSCDINGDGTQDIVLGKAEHVSPNLKISFQISLGDGQGAFNKVSAKDFTLQAPNPKTAKGGMFSVTNINGGLYPSLAYVYQQDDNSMACFSVDGRSNGTLSELTQYPLTDLNGIGMGGWLMYSLNNELTPTLFPIYNTTQPTDLLSSAQDPMGLVTSVSYGCLSDTTVYKSTDPRDYIVQGAPNYVVKTLMHTNNPERNALDFSVSMKKTYYQAMVNSQGRGWLGFQSIRTENVTDSILTEECYFQKFPKIGIKSKINTLTLQNELLSSKETDYEAFSTTANQWKIYHVNKVFDQLTTIDPDETKNRVQRTEFTCDIDGNIILKHTSEIQGGEIQGGTPLKHTSPVFQSWERCTYDTINGIKGLLASKKLTGVEQNQKSKEFEKGDVSLVCYAYNKITAILETESRWSDDVSKFLTTTHAFDQFGNEVSVVDPAGLTTKTTYDDTFHNLAISQEEVGKGVSTRTSFAYDQASGELVAKLEPTGRLTCIQIDNFGRKIETRLKSLQQTPSSVAASDFLKSPLPLKTDRILEDKLKDPLCLLDPFEIYSYDILKGPVKDTAQAPRQYLSTRTMSYFNAQDTGQREVGTSNHVSWKYWTFDSRGNTTFESFPISNNANNLEYVPEPTTEGTISTRPSHNDPTVKVMSTLQYSRGGASVSETVQWPDPNPGGKDVVLWTSPRSFVSIDGKEHVQSVTHQKDLLSEFRYDAAGNLVSAVDPTKETEETREYSSIGQLRVTNNIYQKMTVTGKPSVAAMTYVYDDMGQLIKTVNANEESITFKRDSKGRPLRKIGSDGRVLMYEYDKDRDYLLSMTVHPQGELKPLETQLNFTYDELGQLRSRTLVLADGKEYETNFTYDWHGQTTTKSYANKAVKENQYMGALLTYSLIREQSTTGHGEKWLDSRFEYMDAVGKPSRIVVGEASMESHFEHTFAYDRQSYPLSHSLDQRIPDTGSLNHLVNEAYAYNGAGQLTSNRNEISGTIITSGPDDKSVIREEPNNGGTTLMVGEDYSVRAQADGSKITTLKLMSDPKDDATPSSSDKPNKKDAARAVFTDSKGNVKYKFRGSDGSRLQTITYDDFGAPTICPVQADGPTADMTATFESKKLDLSTQLLDFGSRWYDPLVGRFTSPDDILDVKLLAKTHGLNRMAFENNDPINNTDPTGQFSLSAIFGTIIGGLMVGAAIFATVASGGALAPLAAAGVGALFSGGIAGIKYSLDHRNERGGKFWAGFIPTVLVNAAIGGATGYLGAVATPASLVSATGRLGQAAGWSLSSATTNAIGKAASFGSGALIGATSSLLTTVAHNVIENAVYDTHYGVFEGAGIAALMGGAIGAAASGWGAARYKGESVAATRTPSLGKGLWSVAQADGDMQRLKQWGEQKATNWYQDRERELKELSSMFGPSGKVGSLNIELSRNQLYVNYG